MIVLGDIYAHALFVQVYVSYPDFFYKQMSDL